MADEDPIKWDNQRMFERYLYDYLRKNNMHQTAEIFRNEADVSIDTSIPISIDVPDGFLHEWWLLFYDMFMSRQVKTHKQDGEPSMTKVEGMVANGTQSKASLLRQNEMNEQTLGNLAIGADYGMTTGANPLPLTMWPLAGTQQITRGLPSFQHQQELVARPSGVLRFPVNFADLVGQGLGSQVYAASGRANVPKHEKTRYGKKPCKSEDGISGMRGVTEASSDASAFMEKSCNDGEPSYDNEDGKGSSSSNLQRSTGSLEAKASKDGILLGGILGKYSTISCRPHPSTCTLFGKSIRSLMT